MQFLAQRGYLLPDAAGNAKHAEEKTELWSNELTSEGYRFVQYAGDRWVGRLLKRDD
jgi:hypothetical protein